MELQNSCHTILQIKRKETELGLRDQVLTQNIKIAWCEGPRVEDEQCDELKKSIDQRNPERKVKGTFLKDLMFFCLFFFFNHEYLPEGDVLF